MSEAERLQRQEYKRNRKKWILIQAIALILVGAFALTFFTVYLIINSTLFGIFYIVGTVHSIVNCEKG